MPAVETAAHTCPPMNPLTTQLYPTLLRHAALLLSGSAAAQAMQPGDLLHMAVERLYTRPPAEIREHPSEFTGLVRTVMQRMLLNELRKAGAARRPDLSRAARLEEAFDIPAGNSASTGSGALEALSLLESQNADAAALLRMYYLEGLTGVEIAARLGTSSAAVSRRLANAIGELREIYTAAD